MTLPEWLSRMDAHLIQQDAYLARKSGNESSAIVETGQRCKVTRVDGLMVFIQPE